MLRAAFMGSPEFAVPSLEAVRRRCDLRVVVCQPDRPAGRGRALTPPAVKVAASGYGVPIVQPVKMKDGTLLRELTAFDLDVAIVVAFGRILPADLLALPKHGCLNVHASVLPRWRGAAPIQRAILAGDRETGVSIMQMDVGLDTGPVHRVVKTEIEPLETQGELFARLSVIGAAALDEFLAVFPDVPDPVAQDEDGVVLAPPLVKSDGVVAWDRTVREIVDHVRGMDPWPVATSMRKGEPLKLFAARPSTRTSDSPPGTVLGVDANGMHVAVRGGAVCIGEVQGPGQRRMAARAYAAGHAFATDERLG
jgi:methionyl-tRNA formyltransferase